MHVIYEDNHLLAIDKPAGLPSQPDSSGDLSLIDQARAWVKEKYAKPGDVYLALVHRLDRPVSGIILTARTSKAAGRVADIFRRRDIEKKYLALVEWYTKPDDNERLVNILRPKGGGMEVVNATGEGKEDKKASLTYSLLARSEKRALLLVTLETGVKHQIRAQLAFRGMPVVGDFRYGPHGKPARPESVENGRAILLHSAQLSFIHPVAKKPLDLRCSPPKYWQHWFQDLPSGGSAALKQIGL